jgi:hypothetical protein
MFPPDSSVPDDWMDARVEGYVDGRLSPTDTVLFEVRLRHSPYWQAQVDRARSIRAALEAQRAPAPPAELVTSILSAVAARAQVERPDRTG